ncbi:hypothetical protein ADK60_32080 [Streptomyces sp. XY431]|nr:hypothetical protein ADK60_32080 [Streptomyces sp. XY431]
MHKRGLQQADHVVPGESLAPSQTLYQRCRNLGLLFLEAAKVHTPLNQSQWKTLQDLLADSLGDVPLDLGRRQRGPMIQPFMRKLMENYMLGVIST